MFKDKKPAVTGIVAVCMAACLLLIQGCASLSRPTSKIADADLKIQEARDANAINYAPVELKAAEDKLRRAREAMDEEKNAEARRLAGESYEDARTAEARSSSEKARQTAQQMKQEATQTPSEALATQELTRIAGQAAGPARQ